MNAITIGLDIAKSVFQVHGEDSSSKVVLQKRLKRAQVERFFAKLPPCVVGIEACGTAHHWGRCLQALGHDVRLIPAAQVKPFVRRNKTDARDAAAICAALGRPDIRAVRVKTVQQQAARSLERTRALLIRQRVQLCNSLRSQLAEYGVVAAKGRRGFAALVDLVEAGDARIPDELRAVFAALIEQSARLSAQIDALEGRIVAAVKTDLQMRRLCTIPGVGPILAHAIVAAIGDGRQFRSARDFAAWAGLTRREHQSANRRRNTGISRAGDVRLRCLFALGASTILRIARTQEHRASPWQRGILARRPVKVAVVAQAAKTARIAWAVLTSGQPYRPQAAA